MPKFRKNIEDNSICNLRNKMSVVFQQMIPRTQIRVYTIVSLLSSPINCVFATSDNDGLTLLCIFIFPKCRFQWNVYHQSLWFQHISTMRYFWHWAISSHSISNFSLTIIAVTTDHKLPPQAPWYLVTHISSQIKSNKCEIPKNYEKKPEKSTSFVTIFVNKPKVKGILIKTL